MIDVMTVCVKLLGIKSKKSSSKVETPFWVSTCDARADETSCLAVPKREFQMPKVNTEKKNVKKVEVMVPEKKSTAPLRKPMSNDGRSVNADEPKLGVKWTEFRVACVKAMRALGATSEAHAVTAEAIGKKMGKVKDKDGNVVDFNERIDKVKIYLDVYRTSELLHNDYAKSTRHEGERGLKYYLTPKGIKTDFSESRETRVGKPKAEPKADKPAAKGKDKKAAKSDKSTSAVAGLMPGGKEVKKPAAKKSKPVQPEPGAQADAG